MPNRTGLPFKGCNFKLKPQAKTTTSRGSVLQNFGYNFPQSENQLDEYEEPRFTQTVIMFRTVRTIEWLPPKMLENPAIAVV